MVDADVVWNSNPRDTVHATLPDGTTFEGKVGTKLETFVRRASPDTEVPYMAALVDGRLRELSYPLQRDAQIAPIDLSQSDGVRIYRRSLTFLMLAAAQRLFPKIQVYVDHSLPFGGYFCEVRHRAPLTDTELLALSGEMQRMVAANYPIRSEHYPLEEALKIFSDRGEIEKVEIFRRRTRNNKTYLKIYELRGYRAYMHGYMVPTTGYLRYFRLLRWEDGFILQFPRRHQPTRLQKPIRDPQLLSVFRQYSHWLRLLGVTHVADLNQALDKGKLREVVLVSEALHEQRIADIARQISERRERVRVILIAGPSSSGKTTFSKRLAVQLLAHGLRPYALELDNYFVDRDNTPRDKNGEYDFEALEALDIQLFDAHLQALMRGQDVQLPRFNFITGMREPGKQARLSTDQIIIIEGIHGLNPKLVPTLPEGSAFRIYVSALTQLNIDRHNRVPTTDTRLIRRIVRDARTRGYSAMDTIARWESVRRGEKQHIFPYQENADVMFNSALVYELAVLKSFAEPLLLQVDPDSRQRVEAKRLLAFLQWFYPADAAFVPENSILREFVGGLSLEDFAWGD